MAEPIESIIWKHWKELKSNNYNPNCCFTPELKLLERNILALGWCQPILCTSDFTIIDGFHRWMLMRESIEMQRRWGGMVPVAVLDVPRSKAMILTIRMNRAKGSHVAIRMHEMVRELIDESKMTREALALEIGATLDEIDLLYQEGVFSHKDIANYKYSKSWIPKETRNEAP